MSGKRFDQLANQSLADQARDLIRQAIFEGKIKPEERLTIERIAEDLGISRTPVREALKALEADGILRVLPRRGAIVEKFDADEVYDRYTVRAMLEGYAGERACKAHAVELAGELSANCDILGREVVAVDPDDLNRVRRLVELNRAFHQTILKASGSATVTRMLGTVSTPLAYQLYYWRTPARQQVSLHFHRQIAEAFRANQPQQARRLMEDHLLETRDFLMSIQRDLR